MRSEYTMTDQQQATIMEASKPVPYMVFGGKEPRSPQENANAAWRALGEELGFDSLTVQPVPGKDDRHFTAQELVPSAEQSKSGN